MMVDDAEMKSRRVKMLRDARRNHTDQADASPGKFNDKEHYQRAKVSLRADNRPASVRPTQVRSCCGRDRKTLLGSSQSVAQLDSLD